MISEFHQLSEKVRLLAELTQTLRHENADLRKNAATLVSENADLVKRINEAHRRVAALLDKIPALPQDEPLVQPHVQENA
ncbi:DUF904 domain-containing protein [Glaciimonas sp. CA11.2]|uniref:DUF904 domain-containing protein n=1 Tax=unclassified Glaciimonas TaxID=2644401 RepID=UPI002AB32B3C|nr:MULTISPECIES: DUF904 domain-containing protein [unclassified Glaciimonas]MDY7545199.1 DUF904 domain-containing protein [Glaciimonas sp. CA11.2]MEB0011302.1 DUF904 domain-containing protein [Glaciimonas sp. Cout2]MEB0080952.1 DUF904 domain-containing protein [Glaciimonas sp. Gout2]MEB0162448.1 DUF904 domain-containing protein [Glaciimonas sp. CA11.2]